MIFIINTYFTLPYSCDFSAINFVNDFNCFFFLLVVSLFCSSRSLLIPLPVFLFIAYYDYIVGFNISYNDDTLCMYVTLVYDDTSKTVNCKRKEQLGGAQQKLPAGPRIKRPARAVKA